MPDNFLLSCRNVVPGVQRLGANAMTNAEPAPTRAFLSIASQLEPPQLCDVRAVVLSGLRLHLPDGFVAVARQHAASVWRRAHAGGAAAGGALGAAVGTGRLLPLADLQQRLSLRVSVHNGRRFVGPPAVCQAAALEPAAGRRGAQEEGRAGCVPDLGCTLAHTKGPAVGAASCLSSLSHRAEQHLTALLTPTFLGLPASVQESTSCCWLSLPRWPGCPLTAM